MPAPRTSPPSISGRYTVRAGDTLYRIARDARPEAVSLDQMLVALYRSNPQAFNGDNINRLFAGAVLAVPDAAVASAITEGEARQVIQAHSADMAAYRQRLAARADLTGQSSATRASGRVEALVQDRKQPAAPKPDQLKLSQATVAGKPSAEAALSQQAQAQEAARRESELQRNLDSLKRLDNETKTASTPAGSAVPAGSGVAVAGAAGSEEGGAMPGVAGSTPINSDAPPPSPLSQEAESSPPTTAADAPASAVAADADESPSPMLAMYGLAAGGALGTLLLALGGMRLVRRRKGRAGASFLSEREAIEPSGDLPDVPALNDAPMTFDEAVAQRMVGQPDLAADAAVARSGDPVAEADVYIAYGRLQQAEGLLQAAIRDEPHRLDIQLKLLELYAMQKDLEAFDAQAETLYEMSGGQGAEWTRALGLRRSLAPPTPAMPRVEANAGKASFEDDVDLAFASDTAAALSPTLDANEVSAMARAPRPTPPEASSLPARPIRPEAVPSLGPEPEQTEAGEFALDLGSTVGSRPPRPQRHVDLGQTSRPGVADPDAGDPLDRKLALAEEFIQIGDLEGARDLLGEVGAKGDGPLKERAQRLLSTLG
jgi:pilus assembly protein FimV